MSCGVSAGSPAGACPIPAQLGLVGRKTAPAVVRKFGIFIVWGAYSVPSYGGGHSASEWFWWYWQGAKEPWAVDFMERNYLKTFTYPDFTPKLSCSTRMSGRT